MNSDSLKFRLLNFRLGVKLEYVVPVINFAELAFLLQKSGYFINNTNQIYFSGSKGAVQFYLDGMKDVFGVIATTVDDTVATIHEIFTLTNEELDFDLNDYVGFFEFEINANYYLQTDAYVTMAKLFQDSSDMKTLNRILKGNFAQTSLKLTPATKNINNLEWYDLTIEPKVNSAGNILLVRVLCRGRNLKDMTENAKRTEKIATSIINGVFMK
jgi:hypothetical protein